MKDTLICTIGTSLFTNINRLDEKDPLRIAKANGNWIGLAKKLILKSPEDKICGAEINSITSLCQKNLLNSRDTLYLLISDTDDARDIGEILKRYYEDSKNLYRFERVLIKDIKGLTDDDVKSFRNQGLRNLVKEIAKILNEIGSERILINATGGYKAQISFAGLIGQAMEIPVLYMFENFSEIITLPPLPLSFNFNLWLRFYEQLNRLATEDILRAEDIKVILKDERLLPLIDEEIINGEKIVSLSYMGQLFHESFRYRFKKQKKALLPPELSEDRRKEPRLSEHFYHHPPHFAENMIKKIWKEKKYITTISDFYVNPDSPEKNHFEFDKTHNCIVFTYSDGTKTAKFRIEIPEATESQLMAALVDLNETYL